jgi:hypothetical protein
MRIGIAVAIGLSLLCCVCPAASAGHEIYLLGGATMANLGGDAELFGDVLAASLEESLPGTTWRSEKKSRLGFDLGAGYAYMTPGIVGGAVEIRYVTRGAKYDLDELSGSGVRVESTMKLDYVEIPVLLQLAPQTAGSVKPVFVAGPVLGIKAASNYDFEVAGESESIELEGMNSTYFAGLLGAGMKIRTTETSSLLVQARFQLGLSNLVDDPNFSIKPQDFSILAGYSFGF